MNLTQAPKIAPFGPKKASNSSKLSFMLRERIESNIENRNCYCIQINLMMIIRKRTAEEVVEGEEEGEDKVQGIWYSARHADDQSGV